MKEQVYEEWARFIITAVYDILSLEEDKVRHAVNVLDRAVSCK